MRIAFVLSALQAGGAERVVSLLAGAALRKGWAVTVISFDAPGDPIFHKLDREVDIVRLAVPAGMRAVPRRILALRRVVVAQRFDVVIAFLGKISVITLAACLGLATRVVISERNNPNRQPMHPLWRLAQRRLYPYADAIVMQTARSVDCLPPAVRHSAVVIPNPVRLETSLPARSGEKRIVAVGRLTEQKGFDLLISAFAAIARVNPGWQLVIWGEGSARAQLEAQVVRLHLGASVSLPGISPGPECWTQNADIFVLPSRYEGFPNVVLEAMAAGLAIAAFDCDFGPSELIDDQVSGLLVAAASVPSLAWAINALIADADRREALGRAARTAASRYDEGLICQKWLSLVSAIGHSSAVPSVS